MAARIEPGLCAAIGVLLLIAGFIAYSYEEKVKLIWVTYPYRNLGLLSIGLGVVLIIIGAKLLRSRD